MLSESLIEQILTRLPSLTVGVLGDLFLDRYLHIDAALTEPSVETGLDAYQVTAVRSYPGAAGTVINNLAALGVGRVIPVGVIGDDGEGYELRQALAKLSPVDATNVLVDSSRRTPTYTKPMLHKAGQPGRELNRFDIKNRVPTPPALEEMILERLRAVFRHTDALIVLDQVSEEDCGVVTGRVREELARLVEECPTWFVLADSRERIGRFRSVCLKPNGDECARAVGGGRDAAEAAAALASRADAVVFCTRGAEGVLVAYPDACRLPELVPAYPVAGPIDIVGAGDSASAGITCVIAAGASPEEAAAFGNLVASITVQQIGVTGTASPEQVRRRWREVAGRANSPS